MPETRTNALKRAKAHGFPKSAVVKAPGTKHYFIAPHGVTTSKAKRAYAGCREGGGSQSTCAAVSHNVQKKRRKK